MIGKIRASIRTARRKWVEIRRGSIAGYVREIRPKWEPMHGSAVPVCDKRCAYYEEREAGEDLYDRGACTLHEHVPGVPECICYDCTLCTPAVMFCMERKG